MTSVAAPKHTTVINGTVTSPIVLGTGNYGHVLTITATGAVAPSQSGATAITGPKDLTNAHIINQGVVDGGSGAEHKYSGGNGGAGIILAGGGVVTNTGDIAGGDGAYGNGGHAGNGGFGVDLKKYGTVSNTGTISGGSGGSGGRYYDGANGATGVNLAAGGSLVNHGLIFGGSGGYGNDDAGAAGDGVFLGLAGYVENSGSIIGGTGGESYYEPGRGGVGVQFAAAGTLVNHGVITGAYYNGTGVLFGGLAVLDNDGTIRAEGAASGVDLMAGGTMQNAGIILGGGGAYGDYDNGGRGGAGVQFIGAGSLSNHGTVTGGAGGNTYHYVSGDGGVGVSVTGAATLTNTGAIAGGRGGYTGNYYAGNGGNGVLLLSGATLANHGTITGGVGGFCSNGYAGVGGIGVSLETGETVTNTGSIIGGAGGSSHADPGATGGAGVYLNGGELVDKSGLIAGGAPGAGNGGTPLQGDAVRFSSVTATLAIYAAATFSGDIVANVNADDVLALEGTAPGTLSGLGTTITGFDFIEEAANAHWTITGPVGGEGALVIGAGATLQLDGAVTIPGIEFASGAPETLKLEAPTQTASIFTGFAAGDTIDLAGLKATSLNYSQGTLTLFNANNAVVDTIQLDGTYTNASFELQPRGTGTDLIGVSGNALPDFLPLNLTTAGPRVESFGGAVSSPLDEQLVAMLHDWHFVLL